MEHLVPGNVLGPVCSWNFLVKSCSEERSTDCSWHILGMKCSEEELFFERSSKLLFRPNEAEAYGIGGELTRYRSIFAFVLLATVPLLRSPSLQHVQMNLQHVLYTFFFARSSRPRRLPQNNWWNATAARSGANSATRDALFSDAR